MAQSNPGGSTGPSAIINVALIILTIAGIVTFVGRELTSDRPTPPSSPGEPGIGSQTVNVRLWEDPLRPSKEDKRHDLAELTRDVESKASYRRVWLLPVMVSGGSY